MITPEQLAQTRSRSLPVLPNEEPSALEGTASDLMTALGGAQTDFFRASEQIQLLKAKREELLECLFPLIRKS